MPLVSLRDKILLMALKIEIPYSTSILSPKDLKATYAYFANFENSVGTNFPGLEVFKSQGGDKYDWQFQKVEQSGYGIQIKFATQFQKEAEKAIRVEPIASGEATASLKGSWEFESAGDKTKVNFKATFTLELPLPFFLKSVAGPFAQKEISKLFERYTSNVSKAISA